jgi:hypothetical protein
MSSAGMSGAVTPGLALTSKGAPGGGGEWHEWGSWGSNQARGALLRRRHRSNEQIGHNPEISRARAQQPRCWKRQLCAVVVVVVIDLLGVA